MRPLSSKAPIAIGRRVDCDDALAKLNDGSFANLHLVWGKGSGASHEHYPNCIKYENLPGFIAEMEKDSLEYEE